MTWIGYWPKSRTTNYKHFLPKGKRRPGFLVTHQSNSSGTQLFSAVLVMAVWIVLLFPVTVRGTLSPACRCVHFDDTYGKEYGVFTSPNWPAPYEESQECLLYTFAAGEDQLVEVTFDEFDVQKTSLE